MKILIVDDDTNFRQTLRELLCSQLLSLTILEAKDGEEALRMVPTFLPDLIFMDIRLPGQNGLEITRKIKADHKDITIIVVTGYNLLEYEQAAIHSGASGFIGKDSLNGERISRLVKYYLSNTSEGR